MTLAPDATGRPINAIGDDLWIAGRPWSQKYLAFSFRSSLGALAADDGQIIGRG